VGVDKFAVEVVIVLGSSQIALAIAREAVRLGAGTVKMIDTVSDVGSFSNCSSFHQLNQNFHFDEVFREIDKVVVKGKTVLFADSDQWLDFVKKYRLLLDSMVSVLHPTNDVLELCLSKSKFGDWCTDNAIRTAERIDEQKIANGLSTLDFPLIIRPDKDIAIKTELPKCVSVETAHELNSTVNRYRKAGVGISVTRSLLGLTPSQVSVGFCRRANGDCITFVAEKIRPFANFCGTGTLVKSTDCFEYVRSIAQSVAEKMNFVGIGEMEFLVDKGSEQAYLIEINARPWMQFSLAKHAGVDIVAFALNEAQTCSENQQSFFGEKTWCNFGRDFEFLLAKLWAKKISPATFTVQVFSYLHVSEWAFFRFDDLKPVFKLSKGWCTQFLIKVNKKSLGHLKDRMSVVDKG
jgi:predicted ATP-grasp superfamily ATP-dependent carboligase